jgi:hypothetical protein
MGKIDAVIILEVILVCNVRLLIKRVVKHIKLFICKKDKFRRIICQSLI